MSFTGEYDKGQPLIEEALRIRRKAVRRRCIADVAKSLADLGVNFGERGDFKQAEVYLRQALELQRKLHPAAHPGPGRGHEQPRLGAAGLGEFDGSRSALSRGARRSSESSMATRIRSWPPGSTTSAFVARDARRLSRRGTGLPRVAGDEPQAARREPSEIAAGMSNLAFVLYAKGDHRAAIQMMRESIEMNRRELGPEHPDVAGGGTSLAYWLDVGGRVRRGGEPARRGARDPAQGTGPRPSPAREHADGAGQPVRRAQAVRGSARRVRPRRCRSWNPSLPADHWLIAMAKNVQGAALTGLGRYAEAEKLLLASLPDARGLADFRPAGARPRAARGALHGLGQAGKSRKIRSRRPPPIHITRLRLTDGGSLNGHTRHGRPVVRFTAD